MNMGGRDKLNVEKILQVLARGQTNISWSETINEMIKLLKRKRKLEDRLDYAELLMEILNAMTYSVKGWHQWGNIYRLNKITKEEYEEFILKLLEAAVMWLEIDRDLTAKKEKEIQKKTDIKAENKQSVYVA